MIIPKAKAIPRFIVVSALVILSTLCSNVAHARGEFYIRPLAQYTYVPASSRNADSDKTYNYGGGVAFSNSVIGTNYTLPTGTLGAGVSIGSAFGREHHFEVGAEVTQTKSTGTYFATPVIRSFNGSTVVYTPTGPGQVKPCDFKVTSVVATYRQFFGLQADQIRPYLGCILGLTDLSTFEGNEPPATTYVDYKADGIYLTAGLGAGVSIRLWRKASIEAGYRLLSSRDLSHSSDFYRFAHTLNIALQQRF